MLNVYLEVTIWSRTVLDKLIVAHLSRNICLLWTPPPPQISLHLLQQPVICSCPNTNCTNRVFKSANKMLCLTG